MKYMRQIGIILTISFIGEILNAVIPIQVPASIYGLIIMFVCLKKKIIKLDSVKDTGKFLIEIMPLMFIPAAVGLINSWSVLKAVFIPIVTITIFSTIIMMGVTGRTTQKVIAMDDSEEIDEIGEGVQIDE